jgi:hypothetical protein
LWGRGVADEQDRKEPEVCLHTGQANTGAPDFDGAGRSVAVLLESASSTGIRIFQRSRYDM